MITKLHCKLLISKQESTCYITVKLDDHNCVLSSFAHAKKQYRAFRFEREILVILVSTILNASFSAQLID